MGEFDSYFPKVTDELIGAIESGSNTDSFLPDLGDSPAPATPDSRPVTSDEAPVDLDADTPAPDTSDEQNTEDTPTDTDPDTGRPLDPAERSRLRQEAAEHRTRAKAAEDTLAVFGDGEDRATWVNLAKLWADDPKAAASWMQEIAGNVLGTPPAPAAAQPPAPAPAEPSKAADPLADLDDDMPLTKAEILAVLERREADRAEAARQAQAEQAKSQAQQDAIRQTFVDAKIDPNGNEARWVLTWAIESKKSIGEGIKAYEAWQQGIRDSFRTEKTTAAETTVTAPDKGAAAEEVIEFDNPDDYFKAGSAWYKEQMLQRR